MKFVSPRLSTLFRVRGRPEPVHHPYLRCDQCGEIAPRTEERTVSTLGVPWPAWIPLPPESLCPLCGHSQPRVVDDELPMDVELACTSVVRWHGVWLTCRERYAAHSAAAFAICPRCGTRADLLVSPRGHRRRNAAT
jgi:rRNA maturation endonuclease Nob1